MTGTFLTDQLDTLRTGNLSGWALVFDVLPPDAPPSDAPPSPTTPRPIVIDSSQYDAASIEITLESGIGGTARIALEGLTDSVYASIGQHAATQRRLLRIHLYWRDTNQTAEAYLANLSGLGTLSASPRPSPESLVGLYFVDRVSRRAGARLVQTEIVCTDLIAYRLSQPMRTALNATGLANAVTTLAQAARVGIQTHALPTTPTPGDKYSFSPPSTYANAAERLGQTVAEQVNAHGLGMLLIRDGVLHLGKRRVPLAVGAGAAPEAKKLTPAAGLIAAEPTSSGERSSEGSWGAPTGYRLTLKGRADLKPGDVVIFDPPASDVPTARVGLDTLGALGQLAGAFTQAATNLPEGLGAGAVSLYVQSIRHQLGRTSGFSTELAGILLADPKNQPWVQRDPTGAGINAATERPLSADPAATARRLLGGAANSTTVVEVGEVRRFTPAGSGDPPGGTTTVWRGLVEGDRRPRAADRLAPRRSQPAELPGVPQATPFAWGPCGLILPRYPGTRVVLAHRGGDPQDPIDVGALRDRGQVPSGAKMGDWWLILPAWDGDPPQSVAENVEPPKVRKASDDLIDAQGNRVIEVGELTIRVGSQALDAAGDRPARAADQGSVTIEHTGGAKVVLLQDGTVRIEGKSVEIRATENISLEAANVDVRVSGRMNVHD
jgi:hypothetical protein